MLDLLLRISTLSESFTLDDATYTSAVTGVPEPSSIFLFLTGFAGVAVLIENRWKGFA